MGSCPEYHRDQRLSYIFARLARCLFLRLSYLLLEAFCRDPRSWRAKVSVVARLATVVAEATVATAILVYGRLGRYLMLNCTT